MVKCYANRVRYAVRNDLGRARRAFLVLFDVSAEVRKPHVSLGVNRASRRFSDAFRDSPKRSSVPEGVFVNPSYRVGNVERTRRIDAVTKGLIDSHVIVAIGDGFCAFASNICILLLIQSATYSSGDETRSEEHTS